MGATSLALAMAIVKIVAVMATVTPAMIVAWGSCLDSTGAEEWALLP